MPLTPEQQARQEIDTALAGAGWISQDRGEMNLAAGLGVAVREFRMAPGHGFADYMPFVDGQAVGVLEAKPVGYTLSSVELQADQYATGLPAGLNPPVNPLPFLYVSTGVDTRFINGVRRFRDRLFMDISPGRTEVPKTLIFAKDDSHAEDIVEIVRDEFGRGTTSARRSPTR